MISYGYRYINVTVPQMTVSAAEPILTAIFPRKISLASDDDANAAIPEWVAFWRYLKRAYHLPLAFERKFRRDNRRRFVAIHQALKPLYPTELRGKHGTPDNSGHALKWNHRRPGCPLPEETDGHVSRRWGVRWHQTASKGRRLWLARCLPDGQGYSPDLR